jgi:DNA-binding transcriptional MerR regulator
MDKRCSGPVHRRGGDHFPDWERRYGYPKPQRDAKGQGLYSERDIQGIAWLSEQTSHGVAISRAVVILRGGYAVPGTAGAPAPSAARSFAALRSELLDGQLAFDRTRRSIPHTSGAWKRDP